MGQEVDANFGVENDAWVLGARDYSADYFRQEVDANFNVENDACVLGARDIGIENGCLCDCGQEDVVIVCVENDAVGVGEDAVGVEEVGCRSGGSADNRDTTKIGRRDLNSLEMHVCSHYAFLETVFL